MVLGQSHTLGEEPVSIAPMCWYHVPHDRVTTLVGCLGLFMCMSTSSECTSVQSVHGWCRWRPEKQWVGFPRTGIRCGYELLWARNWTWVVSLPEHHALFLAAASPLPRSLPSTFSLGISCFTSVLLDFSVSLTLETAGDCLLFSL